jgi:hypothetical protein
MAAHLMPYPYTMPRKTTVALSENPHLPFNQLLCRYRSKVCTHPRAYKRDGSLHRYCEEHRQRANSNQKKWVKRRMQVVDEGETRQLQLSHQRMNGLHHMVSLQRAGSTNGHVPIPPAITETLNTPLCEWMDAELDFELPTFEIDMANELLWETPEFQALMDGADIKFEL